MIVADPQTRWSISRLHILQVIPITRLSLPDMEATLASQQQLFLLDSKEGKRIASPLLINYRDSNPNNSTPLLKRERESGGYRNVRASGLLGLVPPTATPAMEFDKELLLLARSTQDCMTWREKMSGLKGENVNVVDGPRSPAKVRFSVFCLRVWLMAGFLV